VVSRYYYGEVKQDWGTISLGRLKDSYTNLGLANLGWAPDGPDINDTYMGVFDTNDATSGARYKNRWDNFQLALAGFRLGAQTRESKTSDETNDLFVLEPAFFWEGGGGALGIHYQRDHIQKDMAALGKDLDKSDPLPTGPRNWGGTENPSYKLYAVNPAVSHSFGDFSIHAEGKMGWGTWKPYYGAEDVKISGYAAYLDFDYNYGPGNVNLAAWWASGPDDKEDSDKITGAVDMGSGFAPLVVAYRGNGNAWNRDPNNAVAIANERNGAAGSEIAPMANHLGIDLNGAHAFTDDLTLTYAVAYLALNETREGGKKEIGWEADLGLQVQLLDNLHFGTTFGYLMAGDALKEIGSDKDPENAYTWLNTLTFSF
jgi:hypothetical protein